MEVALACSPSSSAPPYATFPSRFRSAVDCRTVLRRGSPASLRRGPVVGGRRSRIARIYAELKRFTEKALKAVSHAQEEARRLGTEMVYTQHLLLGLVAEDLTEEGFLGSGITIEKARDAVRRIWPDGEGDGVQGEGDVTGPATDVPFSFSCKVVLRLAEVYSDVFEVNFVAPEHIAIVLFRHHEENIVRVFTSLGADMEDLKYAALSRINEGVAKDFGDITSPSALARKMKKYLVRKSAQKDKKSSVRKSAQKDKKSSVRKSVQRRSPKKQKEESSLAQFCVDLTSRASEGLLDPVIGRRTEIQRVVQILCRRTKNNPILIGEPGVGKTAIAEGLALCIAENDAPVFLMDKRIMSLELGLLMAGTDDRGELEARVITLIREIHRAGNVILFIDDMHAITVSGTSSLVITKLLKLALGKEEVRCIASTTIDKHRTHFEKDKALARRFQPVLINEPSQEDAAQMLLGIREKYEAYHKCRFTLEAINAAVYLSARYIPDRYLPDKAIDLIDEAGSTARMNAYKRRKEQMTSVLSKSPNEYWQEIRAVQEMHEMVSENKMKYTGDKSNAEEPVMVGSEEIATVASVWSGIPIQELSSDVRELLVRLDEKLRDRVVGQEDAVNAIARAVKRSRTGLKDPDRPIAAMLFCGPTGVGKTELTKVLADTYFGSETAMVRLDMSEYREQHTVSKLIGSPPGYVGYKEGGTLTEAVRRRPFTIVLLDEIEKAHHDIFNILLQVFEDGHLTDSRGRRVSFKNTLIVMTSNVGSVAISRGGLGFGFFIHNDNELSLHSRTKDIIMQELKFFFRPELLNRIDEIIVFRPLEKNQMMEILHIMLREVRERLATLQVGLEVSDAILKLICEKGYDPTSGARSLRRAMTCHIEDVITDAILAGNYKAGDTVLIDVDSTGNPFVTHFVKHDHA